MVTCNLRTLLNSHVIFIWIPHASGKLEHLFFQNLISNLETSQLCLAKEENMKAEIDAWWKKLDCDPISKVYIYVLNID